MVGESSSGKLGQYKQLQLNGMDEIEARLGNENGKYFSVRNGYLTASPTQVQALQGVNLGDLEDMKVGIHSDV